MLNFQWTRTDITTNEQAADMVALYNKTPNLASAFDSETTGLHIILDVPFLFQFGWITADMQGYTFAVDLELQPQLSRQVIQAWHQLVKNSPIYLAHNVKFDMHMLANIDMPYTEPNLSDSMYFIRYAHNALSVDNGGPPLQLKPYAAQYIDSSARLHEQLLDREKTAIAKDFNHKLALRLKTCGVPPEKYGAKSYTLGVMDKMFEDKLFTPNDLPEQARLAYFAWLEEDIPDWLRHKITARVESNMIRYDKLNRVNLKRYAHFDIVWVLELWYKLNPVIIARDNMAAVELENQLIVPLYEMERVGFKTKQAYLIECRDNMSAYIKSRRQVFYALAGQELKIGQHEKILNLIKTVFKQNITTTRDDELKQLKTAIKHHTVPSQGEGRDANCIAFIDVLSELRTLEKWYSAYITRFINDLDYTDRLYTTIDPVGTVSCRVTSDFQQFPKDPITTIDGVELFHPRKMFEITGGNYASIVYLDFSQIELRFQAIYTILVGHPDQNLCRAYMPYNCINSEGVLFDYENPEHVAAWEQPWFYTEAPNKLWTPTDVHGETTKAAFGIDENHPDFKKRRYDGKKTNFAKNYGAKYKKICTMFPDYSPEQCKLIDEAYYKAFPGVKVYHQYCYDRSQFAYTSNLFGIKYYGVSGHKLINMLVQGSAAIYLKKKILELYNFTKANKLKTRWQMQIHDELSWEHHKDDDPAIFFEYKRIMEDWPDTLVPIVAEMEVTLTDWASKEKVHTIDELRIHLSPRPLG